MPILKRQLLLLVGLILIIWIVSIVGFVFDCLISTFALVPRTLQHLPGVLTMPLVHQGFAHLIANTVPLAAFSALLLTRGLDYFLRAMALVTLGSGLLLWLFGRTAAHIGASGVVFGLFGLLLARALFTRSTESIVVAAVVMLGYGGLIFGVLPTDSSISWDGHLAGLLAGVGAARILQKPS